MLHNYHTHTFRNHHTIGTEREYIESAIKNGFRTLGFSEHAPYRFPDGYISYFHMFPEDLENYIQTLLALKAEYAGRIEILIGYEAEFYPRFFDDFLRRITQYPVDYLLLGQHYIHNEIDGAYVYEPTDDPKILKAYVDQCIAGLDTGLYTYLAHPDLINFTGAETLYRKEMERLCLAAKERTFRWNSTFWACAQTVPTLRHASSILRKPATARLWLVSMRTTQTASFSRTRLRRIKHFFRNAGLP